MIVLRLLAAVLGTWIVYRVFVSAVRTFVVPRAISDFLTRLVALTSRKLFDLRLYFAKSYTSKDWIMAQYAPFTMVMLPPVWLTLVTIGYMLIFWSLGGRSLAEAFLLSGSSILTLGFANADTVFEQALIFSEATLGLILVAMLISYLPTMYNAYSARESAVTSLDVRAGSPPSAIEMILRLHRIGRMYEVDTFWREWEMWFTELEESHTSLPMLTFYRSPVPEYSWVTAAGTVLDSAALFSAVIDKPHNPSEDLCLRAGYLALRRIAGFFGVTYKEDATADDPISITKEEFMEACETLHDAGIPLKENLEKAWLNFKGWRVNYDTVLLALCNITMAPYAPWSSDRAHLFTQFKSPPLFYRNMNS